MLKYSYLALLWGLLGSVYAQELTFHTGFEPGLTITNQGSGTAQLAGADRSLSASSSAAQTGLTASSLAKEAAIYPNPAHGFFSVESQESYTLMLYDANGRSVLQQQQPVGRSRVDVSQVPPGVYVLTLVAEGHTTLRRRLVIR